MLLLRRNTKIYTLGIDISAERVKAMLLDTERKACGFTVRPLTAVRGAQGRPALNPDAVWNVVVECARACIGEVDSPFIAGLAISSMPEACLPLNAEGLPIHDIIIDAQTEEQLPHAERHLGAYTLYEKTGQPPQANASFAHLLRLREEEPEVFMQTRHWVSLGDFILYRMTGELVTDYTQASHTMLFNLTRKSWDAELTAFCGAEGILPPVYSMGTPIGNVRKPVMDALGVRDKIRAYIGGYNQLVALRACRIGPAEMFGYGGEREVYAGKLLEPIINEAARQTGIEQGILDDQSAYWLAAVPSADEVVNWFCRQTGIEDGHALAKLSDADIETNVLFLPYLGGNAAGPAARGAFLGLGINDGQEELIKAIYEGACFPTRQMLTTLRALGLTTAELVNVCGGAPNLVWQSIKADILQKRLRVFDMREMGAYGACILANKDGAKDMAMTASSVFPTDTHKKYYADKYERFRYYATIL